MRYLTETDGYKFSMAEAGWPLREETFYYSQRRGGPSILPFDAKKVVRDLLPGLGERDEEFLYKNEYGLGVGTRTALSYHQMIRVSSIPRLSVFFPGEPVFSVTGPSALASWLEPLVLQLHFRIQIATMALTDPEAFRQEVAVRNTNHEVMIIKETLDVIGVKAPPMEARPQEYYERVLKTAKALVEAVQDPDRIFEVGLRSAPCMEQHLLALEACKEAGIKRTSSVYGAQKLGLKPVGTMGHEHVMRYGSDEAAFRAMRDRRPFRSSYLLDTFDTFLSGIPAAFRLMAERPDLQDSIRYDSGNKEAQYIYAVARAQAMGVSPVHILEDALDLEQTIRFEKLRESLGSVPMAKQVYGYGGALVAKPGFGTITRDRVAAVYKLSQTGPKAVMKFGNEDRNGKVSIPGRPIVWRRIGGVDNNPPGIVAQVGETFEPNGYTLLTDGEWNSYGVEFLRAVRPTMASVWSPETKALRDRLEAEAKKQAA